MLIDSIMFCSDVARKTREGSLVFFNSSLNILNWFKSPCNSSLGYFGGSPYPSLGFSSFNSGFIGSSYWFVSLLSWDGSLVFVIMVKVMYLQYQICSVSIHLQFFLILYFI